MNSLPSFIFVGIAPLAESTKPKGGYKGKDGNEPLRCVACDNELEAGDNIILRAAKLGENNELLMDFAHLGCSDQQQPYLSTAVSGCLRALV